MNALDYANKYRQLGFSIYPMQQKSKLLKLGWSDDEHTNNLISNGCGIALSMFGSLTEDETYFFALDFDDEEAYQAWERLNPTLSKTATAKTNRGYHVIFKMGYCVLSAKSETVSIISSGWYIAVEPSLHPSGKPYTWIVAPWDNIIKVNCITDIANGIDLDSLEWEPDDYYDRHEDDDYYWDYP